jgi:hypothetical protein
MKKERERAQMRAREKKKRTKFPFLHKNISS